MSAPSQLSILFVEDNPVVLDLFMLAAQKLRDELKETGITLSVDSASDGNQGWQKALANKPDLVVSDLYLPVMEGAEFIRRIKTEAATKHVKVLAISASYEDAQRKALDMGADAFMQKPLRLQELLKQLKTFVAELSV